MKILYILWASAHSGRCTWMQFREMHSRMKGSLVDRVWIQICWTASRTSNCTSCMSSSLPLRTCLIQPMHIRQHRMMRHRRPRSRRRRRYRALDGAGLGPFKHCQRLCALDTRLIRHPQFDFFKHGIFFSPYKPKLLK